MAAIGAGQELSVKLNLQMIADAMDELWWEYASHLPGETPSLSGCLLYCGQTTLQSDTLYLIPDGSEEGFPADCYCYATTGSLRGEAPHIRNVSSSFAQMLNLVITVFQRYRDFERDLSNVISSGGSLTQLCRVGSEFLRNPLYIHDNLFAVLAESSHVEGMLEFEYNEKSKKMYIPLWLINEFKFDDSYRRTLSLHQASIWGVDQYPHTMRSLFVNLWDGERYLGRMLVNEVGSSLQPGHFRAAEFFAQYVIAWLRGQESVQQNGNHNFEETFIEIMTTGEADERDLQTILGILDWDSTDQFLCLKLQNQNMYNTVRADSVLNSRLASMLSGCVSFPYQQRVCIVMNMTQSKMDAGTLRLKLAPLIRDSCMYAGISNPVKGIRALYHGFMQADIAMDYITNVDSSDWLVTFASCALSYIRQAACTKLSAQMVAHPVLGQLLEHDAAAGTQYYVTLRTFLECERSIPMTASTLIIHRTTLTYRLGRIQELTRLNLDDPNLRLYLLLSYQLLEKGKPHNGR